MCKHLKNIIYRFNLFLIIIPNYKALFGSVPYTVHTVLGRILKFFPNRAMLLIPLLFPLCEPSSLGWNPIKYVDELTDSTIQRLMTSDYGLIYEMFPYLFSVFFFHFFFIIFVRFENKNMRTKLPISS